MSSVYPLLAALRDVLGAVPGVATCKIGLEANMTPADYPIVRVVPSMAKYGGLTQTRAVECLVYFGIPELEFTGGLEELHANLLEMESALLTAAETAQTLRIQYHGTVFDEDRLDGGYKMLALRLTVDG